MQGLTPTHIQYVNSRIFRTLSMSLVSTGDFAAEFQAGTDPPDVDDSPNDAVAFLIL